MNIEIKVDTAKFDKLLADLPAALARAQRNALEAIGSEVKSQAERAFRHPQYRPSPWAPRKNNADPERPLLYKSGSLRQSIGWKLVGGDTVVVGTDREYAGYHQFGTKHMPARPFFPVDKRGNLLPRVLRKIVGLVEDALSDALRKIGG